MTDWLILGFVIFMGMPILVILVAASFKIAQEYQRAVVFRCGRYVGLRGPGRFRINPISENVAMIDLRTRTVGIEPQEAITGDSVTVRVNAVLYYRVTDPNTSITYVILPSDGGVPILLDVE